MFFFGSFPIDQQRPVHINAAPAPLSIPSVRPPGQLVHQLHVGPAHGGRCFIHLLPFHAEHVRSTARRDCHTVGGVVRCRAVVSQEVLSDMA